eukprot:g7812.t1
MEGSMLLQAIWVTRKDLDWSNQREIEFQVNVRTPLGRGACSVVFAGTHRKTDFSVAIKAMSCAMPTERGALPVATGIANESQVFRHLLERTGGNSHPNVVELIGCFDGDGREASEMGLEPGGTCALLRDRAFGRRLHGRAAVARWSPRRLRPGERQEGVRGAGELA